MYMHTSLCHDFAMQKVEKYVQAPVKRYNLATSYHRPNPEKVHSGILNAYFKLYVVRKTRVAG
jgi:hypothetical protein